LAAAFALTIAACAHPPSPALPAHLAPPALVALQHDLDAVLAQPALAHGYWGVLVKSLKTDETLYAVNANKLMMPASNMKLVTLAAAAEKLGWDYRYETTVAAAGPIDGGVLQGDLIVAGSGDPSLVAEGGMADRVFADWAGRLKERGIRAISGRVIGDDNGVWVSATHGGFWIIADQSIFNACDSGFNDASLFRNIIRLWFAVFLDVAIIERCNPLIPVAQPTAFSIGLDGKE